ncbi:MAG: hypothetical protein Q4C52_05545 [Eubacteriales bacterium]|nr:hypothetical protein [Eubacteriales bacterium]
MTGTELLEQLLDSYQSSYDIAKPFDINGDVYDAYASFNVTSAKYVLIKKAELWRANCFEHTFFRYLDNLSSKDLETFHRHVVEYIEPELVRGGKSCPDKDHMYTFMTGIFICENGVPEDVKKQFKKYHFVKNYRFSIRGYSEVRLLVFDLKNRKIFGNAAAKDLVKGYTKAGII